MHATYSNECAKEQHESIVMMDGTFHGNSRRGHGKYVRTLGIVYFLARQPFCVSYDYIENHEYLGFL